MPRPPSKILLFVTLADVSLCHVIFHIVYVGGTFVVFYLRFKRFRRAPTWLGAAPVLIGLPAGCVLLVPEVALGTENAVGVLSS